MHGGKECKRERGREILRFVSVGTFSNYLKGKEAVVQDINPP